METPFTEGGARPPQAKRNDRHSGFAFLLGLLFAFTILAAGLARAAELEQAAREDELEQSAAADELEQAAEADAPEQAAPSEPPAESDLTAERGPPADPDYDPDFDPDLEEIHVLGTESEATRDFETADSVVGFSGEDLTALGVQDIADLDIYTPNLEIVTSGATTPTFFIRGVGLNDFNPNSTGAVAIYRDDVAINAPALQLSPIFDVEAINVLRGPQGSGLARNASAGAIKIYSRKPTGDFNAFLRSELGNFDSRDFEGAIETPIFVDTLSGRFAFRFSERDGTMKNRCGEAPAFGDRVAVPATPVRNALGLTISDPPWSICSEPVAPGGALMGISAIPTGLPSRINNIDNWAARGTLAFEPTPEMSWLLSAHGSRRDEYSRLGQAYGTSGFSCLNGDIANCYPGSRLFPNGSRIVNVLGGTQGTGIETYRAPEVQTRLEQLAPCLKGVPGFPAGTCEQAGPQQAANQALLNRAKFIVAKELAQELDSDPWAGDFNICDSDQDVNPLVPGVQCDKDAGKTKNDTWGLALNGKLDLPGELQISSVSGYDTYDRFIDLDLDFSPQTLFHIQTVDDGWQVTQDLRLQGSFDDEQLLRWDIGGWMLHEELDVMVTNDLGKNADRGVGKRDYTQELWSAAGYANLSFDFWEDFTLDGGFRYNWEQKKLDFALTYELITDPFLEKLSDSWNAPTGTVRLTYRFREDTHVFWKYTRGWKPGTYNATSALSDDFFTGVPFANVSTADPEQVDSFETGIRGSWFDDRLNLDFSFFYYSYADYQIFTAQQFEGGQPEFVILNADDAEVYGAEVEAVGRPWEGSFINARFGWLESQFLDFVQLQQERVLLGNQRITVNREIQNTGNRLLNSPRFKLSLTAEQTLEIGRWGSVTARYDGVWTDTSYYDATQGRGIPNVQNVQFLPEDTIAQPAFWLHNFRLSYKTPDSLIEVAGWVRNLDDKAYKTFAFDGSTFNNTTIYFVGDPRTYGFTVVFNF